MQQMCTEFGTGSVTYLTDFLLVGGGIGLAKSSIRNSRVRFN